MTGFAASSPGSSSAPVRGDTGVAVVFNPCAGGGRAVREWPEIARAIRQEIGEFTLLESSGPGHIQRLVQDALRQGYARIVAIGGDGTIYEAVNGFFDGSTTINPMASLAIIPMGTGCDFVRTIGVPKGLVAVRLIGKKDTRRVDVGRVTLRLPDGGEGVRYFINVADAGMGGVVAQRANQSSKRLGGFITFFGSVIATLASYRNCNLAMEIDGVRVEQRCRDLIIANGSYYGGGMKVAPEAALDSGVFEVFVIGDVSVPRAVIKLPKLYLGRLKGDPDVKYFRARRVRVQSEEDVLLNLDGEHPGELPATFEVVPSAIRLVVE
ncbi:MAG: diacylglycerol kinase family lipid kinase [Candidatus Hydrogenedentes bacterium]|nr:diacylglycerol kinase family lipid kinase [Candidatus Hydrogenedentota bacterium]